VVKNVAKVAHATLEVTGTMTVYSVALVWVTVDPPMMLASIPAEVAAVDANVVATALITAVPTPAEVPLVGTRPAVMTSHAKVPTVVVVVVVAAAVVTAEAAVVGHPQV
jgi:hypothetical protein